jgi:hypothetical protein
MDRGTNETPGSESKGGRQKLRAKRRGDSTQHNTQNDRNRRRCGGHATEQRSERGSKRKAREEQGGASKKSRRTAMANAPFRGPPRRGGGVGAVGAGGAAAAEAETKADSAVTWALGGFRPVREHCVVAL